MTSTFGFLLVTVRIFSDCLKSIEITLNIEIEGALFLCEAQRTKFRKGGIAQARAKSTDLQILLIITLNNGRLLQRAHAHP